MNFDEVKRSFDRACRIGVEPPSSIRNRRKFSTTVKAGLRMNPLLPNEVPASTSTGTAWNWGASLSLPQQVYAPPEDFLARMTNTAKVREQAVRFCAAAECTPEVKQEIAKFLTCVATPAPILDCAGEKLPALRDLVFVVLGAGVERQEGDWNTNVVLDELSKWNAFRLKLNSGPSGQALSLVELAPATSSPQPPPFPVSIEIANLLPGCGVLTVSGASSLNLTSVLPHSACLWDTAAGTGFPVSRFERDAPPPTVRFLGLLAPP
jgi:hypothetical protein